jgi:hypothetical protein
MKSKLETFTNEVLYSVRSLVAFNLPVNMFFHPFQADRFYHGVLNVREGLQTAGHTTTSTLRL